VIKNIPALTLTLVALTACTSSSSSFYRQARVQTSGSNRITAGDRVVLERCYEKTYPYPDAHGGYCLLIALPESEIAKGAVIRLGTPSVQTYLWQTNGPSHHMTQEVEGELRILAASGDSIRAALTARTSTTVPSRWQWTYEGKNRYSREPVPAPSP
jgi:hypothetical protein